MRILLSSLFLVSVLLFGAGQSTAFAQDTVVNGVNLGMCTHYSDGCNECNVGADGSLACTTRMCISAGVPKCLDTDTSLLQNQTAKPAPDFSVKTFGSCADMRTKMAKFVELAYLSTPRGLILYDKEGIMPLSVNSVPTPPPTPSNATTAAPTGIQSTQNTTDHATTNVRTI